MGIKFLSTSDWHIGHNKVIAPIMYRNIKKFIYPLLSSIDILFIVGDFFHKLIHMDTQVSKIANLLISELLQMAVEYNFKIRIVRGTFHHDREQLIHFEAVNNGRKNKADLKIFSSMSIETMEDIGINVLYVPDDLPYDNAQSEMIRKIHEIGLKKVDIIAIHGFCKHEIPPHVPIQPYNCYDSSFLKKYTNVIIKGHDHGSSVFESTINNGSFERMTHGQEEPKGCFLVDLFKNHHTYKFIENTDTYIFSTIIIDKENIIESFKTQVESILSKTTDDTPLPVFIRYICDHDTHVQLNPSDFEFNQPVRFDYKLIDKKQHEVTEASDLIPMVELPKITKDNLSSLLAKHIDEVLSESHIQKIFNLLEEV